MKLRRLLLPCLLAPALPGCGILNPVDGAGQARLFGKPVPPSSAASAPAEQAAFACKGSDQYEAGLGEQMCSVETRRLELMRQAAEVTNNTMNFNALSWPMGSAVLYAKLKSPDTSLLLPAALATGLYGFLNAGIPGRDAIHRAAAKQLACGEVEASQYLYTKQELSNEGAGELGLLPALRRLKERLDNHASAGEALLPTLSNVKAVSVPSDPISRLGKSTGGSAGPSVDGRAQLERAVEARQTQAARTLGEGRLLLGGIQGSADKLAGVAVAAEVEREAKLASSAPALRDPTAEAAKITAMVSSLIAQSGRQSAGAGVSVASTTISGTALDALTPSSREKWIAFQSTEGRYLRSAVADVQRWLDIEQNRLPKVTQTLAALGCLPASAETRELPRNRDNSTTPPSGTPLPGAAR